MGAATDLLIQLIFGDPCKGIDETRVAVSAGVGAVGGGLGGAAKWFWRARNAAGASAAAAQSIVQAGDHIALGLEAYGLEQTAASVGARHLLKDAAWRTTLQSAIGNPSTRFTIAIDGFAGSSSYGQLMGAAQRGLTAAARATEWEIGQLYQAGRLGQATIMQGGRIILNPFR